MRVEGATSIGLIPALCKGEISVVGSALKVPVGLEQLKVVGREKVKGGKRIVSRGLIDKHL